MKTLHVEQPLTARFNTLIRPYLVLQGALIMLGTIVLIPLIPFWLLGLGQWWARHYYDRMLCELDKTELRFRKGILFTVEKTIPLENIQDVTFIEGPLLRQFNLAMLKFETAGHSVSQAGDMSLVGIIDAHQFRTEILARRTALRQRGLPPLPESSATASSDGAQLALLQKISDQLERISKQLDARAVATPALRKPASIAPPPEPGSN